MTPYSYKVPKLPQFNKPLRVLITNIRLDGRSGTEVFTRNLAAGLRAMGHLPMVYSPQLGAIAHELKQLGIPVLSKIDQIQETPDVIHGHHTLQTGIAAARFPQTPAIFVCHDFTAWHDAPPVFENIIRYVAVGDASHDRLTIESGIDPTRVTVIENAVDTQRFLPGLPLPETPRKALVMVKGLGQLEPILAACSAKGIALDNAGALVGKLLPHPERVFPAYDLIFASGLTAIEAMACLRPVMLCDHRGLAGMVDPGRYPQWRSQNFGLRALVHPLQEGCITAELDRYSASRAMAVGQLVRSECSLDHWVERYLDLYQTCIESFSENAHVASDRAVAKHMEAWCSATESEAMREIQLLQQTAIALRTGLHPLQTGERVEIGDTRKISLHGFHPCEPWGCWSAKPQAVLSALRPPSARPQGLRVEYMPYLSPLMSHRSITCSINGEPAATWTDEGTSVGSVRSRWLPIGEGLGETGALFVSIRTDHSISQRDEGISPDARTLGIGLVAITLLDADANAPEDDDVVVPAATSTPEICTIVLAHKCPPSLIEAVRSLVHQQKPGDVIVVNSGGGDAKALLRDAGLSVLVVERRERLYPGGARNLGLAFSTHRYVAFLASDCLAQPGWIAARLNAHRAGHRAVASALVSHRPRHPIAMAAHLSLFCRRMPRVPVELAQAYGASYDRQLFEQHGRFREDIEGGEDTEFHSRLAPEDRPTWCPEVRTMHRGPSTLSGFLVDQFKRGQRAARAWFAIQQRGRASFAWGVIARTWSTIRVSIHVVEPGSWLSTVTAVPLLVLGGVIYALGIMTTTPQEASPPTSTPGGNKGSPT